MKQYHFDNKTFDTPDQIEIYCREMLADLPDGHPKASYYYNYQVPSDWFDDGDYLQDR